MPDGAAEKHIVYLPLYPVAWPPKQPYYMYKMVTQSCQQPLQLSVSSSPSQQPFAVNQTAAAAFSNVLLDLWMKIKVRQYFINTILKNKGVRVWSKIFVDLLCENESWTCNVVRGIRTLCMPEHEVAGDTTFSCTEHNLQKHVSCIESHVGKAPSPYDNVDIDNAENGIVMHAPEDQAFS